MAQINIKLSEEDKEKLVEFSRKENKTLTKYILDKLLEDNFEKSKESPLNDVFELLKLQLIEKDKQIEKLQTLISQEQELHLNTFKLNESKILVENVDEDRTKKGFWSRFLKKFS